MDGKNRFSFLSVRQRDKKDLIKTTLSQDLRGKKFNHIGCRSDKDEKALFLHPSEEGSEDPRLCSPSGFLALDADARLDFIDPENAGRDGFRRPNGNLQGLFRLSNRSIVESAHIKVKQ